MAGDRSKFDDNYTKSLQVESSVTGNSLNLKGDPTDNNRLFTNATLTDGLELGLYDYVSMALSAGDTTETYIFKTGGSGGTTVSTVVVVYTDNNRDVLSNVTKT